MRKGPLLVVARTGALVALAASSALFLHYVNPVDGAFCGAESGCESVRRSSYAYFGSRFANLPLVGLVAFGAVLFTSITTTALSRAFVPLAAIGGALGIALLALQGTAVDAFCWLCVTVDVAAVVVAAAAVATTRAEPGPEPLATHAWTALAGLAVLAPPLWTAVRPVPDVPAAIRALWIPGKVNVVEFVDFQCGACQALHPVLKKLVHERGDRVHFVRRNMPLKSHRQARAAARAAVCAELQGKGDAMADALFSAGDLGDESNVGLAKSLGLDVEKFVRCRTDPGTEARIDGDVRVLQEAGFLGLPTTYVGTERIVGVRDEAVFREALAAAERGDRGGGVPWPLFLGGAAAAVGAVVWRGRSRPEARGET